MRPGRPDSKEFSNLMRALRVTGRLAGETMAGQQVRTATNVGGGSPHTEVNAVGPGGDPVVGRPREEMGCGDGDSPGERRGGDGLSLWVDPLQRALAQPPLPIADSAAPPPAHPVLAMDEIERAVRRIAWGGDRQRSVAYIELAAGELSGATLTLEARGKLVSVVVDVPVGTSTAGWAERLADRLSQRGLEVDEVVVR